MEMTDNSALLLGKLMRSVTAEKNDGLAVLLTLETEENVQELFTWCKGLEKDPTWQECFDKAVEIRMKNGPDPEDD